MHTCNVLESAYIDIHCDLLENITSVFNHALTYIEDMRGLKHTESMSIEDIRAELAEDESPSDTTSGLSNEIRAKLSRVSKFMKKMVGALCTFYAIAELPANIQNSARFVLGVFSQDDAAKYQYEQPEPENGDRDKLSEAEKIVNDLTDALQRMNEHMKLFPGDETLKEQAEFIEDFIEQFKSTAIPPEHKSDCNAQDCVYG